MAKLDESVFDLYETVIGLEIHVQLNTKSKAYCADVNEYGARPNSRVGVVSLGHPGTLPVVNRKVVENAILLGLALHADIRREMHYARKNYFYADLPKGYQITQDDTPICTGGYVDLDMGENGERQINLTRIHMEEDAGKSIHDQDPFNTLIDLNRAGVPLLEIVSEPELRSGEEAYAYVSEIRKLVRYLDICDGNMEEGSLRCDANVSVRKKGTTALGTRTEVKNMNSFRHVQKAIEFEARRQIEILESGGTIHQETRSFDSVNQSTFSLRSKELAHDYRYFPEPDLQPVVLTEAEINKVREKLPRLPKERFNDYVSRLKLSAYDARLLTEERDISEYFESIIAHTKLYKKVANWVLGDVKSYLNQHGMSIVAEFPIQPEKMAELVELIDQGKINQTVASQKVFPLMIEKGEGALAIAEAENLIQDSDDSEIEQIARQALAKYPEKVAEYKNGKKGVLGLFMGEFMKMARGKADPKKANMLIQKLLEE